MFRTQRPHQRVLDQVVRDLRVAGQRAGIAPQRGNSRLNPLAESAQTRSDTPLRLADPVMFDRKHPFGGILFQIWCVASVNCRLARPGTGCLKGPRPYVISLVAARWPRQGSVELGSWFDRFVQKQLG